jgi:hypothetical protein
MGVASMASSLTGVAQTALAQSALAQGESATAPRYFSEQNYRAAVGCPSAARFRSAVARIAPELPEGVVSKLVLGLRVDAGGYAGRMQFGEITREVTAGVCADAAYALALIVVITLDPEAAVAESAVTARDFEEPAAAETQPTAIPVTDANAAVPRQEKPKPTPNNVTRAAAPEAAVTDVPAVWRLGVGVVGAWGELRSFSLGGNIGLFHEGAAWYRAAELSIGAAWQERDLGLSELGLTRVGAALAWRPRLLGAVHGWNARARLGAELGLSRVALEAAPGVQQRPARADFYAHALAGLGLDTPFGSGAGLSLCLDALLPLQYNRYVVETTDGEDSLSATHNPVILAFTIRVFHDL